MHRRVAHARKAKLCFPPKISNLWLQPPSLQPLSDEDRHRGSCGIHRKRQFPKADFPEKRQTHWDCYLCASSDQDANFFSSRHQSCSPDLSEQPSAGGASPQFCLLVAKLALPILTAMKEQYVCAVDYRTYRSGNHSPRYDDTVSRYITKLKKKGKLQKKAHFTDRRNPILTIDLLETFKHTCVTNCTREETTLRRLSFFAKETICINP